MGGLSEAYQRGKSGLNRLLLILDKLADWYWGDPILRQRHRVEEDARRLGGRVEWTD